MGFNNVEQQQQKKKSRAIIRGEEYVLSLYKGCLPQDQTPSILYYFCISISSIFYILFIAVRENFVKKMLWFNITVKKGGWKTQDKMHLINDWRAPGEYDSLIESKSVRFLLLYTKSQSKKI